jgi:hypothetical protein
MKSISGTELNRHLRSSHHPKKYFVYEVIEGRDSIILKP